jgi:ABC-2 type transport system ATP-binding protein
MTNGANSVIETQGLAKTYGDVQALKGINLSVPGHSITGFLGPNGAGKTTTIQLLLGRIHPTAGSGTIFGMDITRESTTIRRRVGYLPQHPTFDPNRTARETLGFAARSVTKDTHWIETRVDASLSLVGLQDKADRLVAGFSGGETQRLGLAQAQINEPDLLILDEPAAALDPAGRAQVLDVIERLHERSTIFYATHVLNDVQRVSDRVAILNDGRLIYEGPIEALRAGDTEVIYHLSLQGAPERAYRRVKAQPWVSNITSSGQNGTVAWHVAVTDEDAAKHQLLRLVLADEQTDVLDFGRSDDELEDVLMQLIEETAEA